MKLFLSLLLLCGSAIGQTNPAQKDPFITSFSSCIEGDMQGIAITTYPGTTEWNKCINGKWQRVKNVPTVTISTSDDLAKLEARIAALEKQVANLTADHAQDARDREYYGFLFFFSHPELFPSSDESGPCDWTQGTTRDACTAAYKDAQYALALEKRVKYLEDKGKNFTTSQACVVHHDPITGEDVGQTCYRQNPPACFRAEKGVLVCSGPDFACGAKTPICEEIKK